MKKIIALLLALTMLLSLGAASADKLDEIKAAGKLVVGANVLFPPYEFYWTNPETGMEEYAGFDMALAAGLANELGVELVIADQDFAGLVTALRNGDMDCVISGMAIRADRLEVIDFSVPYFSGTQIMVVRAEDAETLTTVEAMAGKKVGAQTGSLQAGILEEQFAASEQMLMDKIPLMVLDLINGELDGLLLTDTVAMQYINVYPGKMVISEVPVVYDNTAGVGVGVQKGDNEAFLNFINAYIVKIQANGEWDAMVEEAYVKSASLIDPNAQ